MLGLVFIGGVLLGAAGMWLICNSDIATNRVSEEWIKENTYDRSGY